MDRIPYAQAVRRDPEQVPAPLRRVVRLLGDVLGEVISEAGGQELLADVERLRRACIDLRRDPTEERRSDVETIVAELPPVRAEAVARAFTLWFQLTNLAEEHYRVGVLAAEGAREEVVHESLGALVAELDAEIGRPALHGLLERLELHPVLTAHPTEARRRSVLDGLQRIAGELARLSDHVSATAAAGDIRRRLREEVAILWRTEQLRRERPSPLDEVRRLMAVFDTSLFTVLPRIYRDLDAALSPDDVGARPPAFRPFLRWGSWVGGDRDGNPRVTADVTRQVLDIHADHVLRGLENAARRISRMLSASDTSTPPSGEIEQRFDELAAEFPAAAEAARTRMPGEPHRRMLVLVAERILATRRGEGGYRAPEDLIDDIAALQRSLAAGGASRLAYGELQHLLWQVETFGFHFAALEVRQHADVHTRALAELAPWAKQDPAALDALATAGWPEEIAEPSASTQEVLATLRSMGELQRRFGVDACRRYVVSFTTSAADVLAVRALARLAVPDGLTLDVVPLFETGQDIAGAIDVLNDVLDQPGEAARLEGDGRRVEVMLGYSDSAKDVGFLAANVDLYIAQGRLAAWADERGVELTLFHGRGGALARGGGPAGRAVRSQAPGSLTGRLKVTEQGEVILNRYRNQALARRHVEQLAHAVVHSSRPGVEADAVAKEERYLPVAERLGQVARQHYRDLVDAEGFTDFFEQVTPVAELSELRLGSRPSRRGSQDGLASLRAIPWVFAWAQNRVNLPGWYGLGTALEQVADERGIDELRTMRDEWPFFATVIESAELSLVKADMLVGERYLELGQRDDLAGAIIDEYIRSERMVREVTGGPLLGERELLRRAVELRDPYVDALSFLQARFLAELRAGSGAQEASEVVRLTVNGIAAGLQNTG